MKELSKCKCNLKATANNYTEFEEEQKLLGKMINHNLSLKTKWTIMGTASQVLLNRRLNSNKAGLF